MEPVFYLLVLFILSQQSILNVSGDPAVVVYTNESTTEYLTVKLPTYHDQTVSECWMKLKNIKTDREVYWLYYAINQTDIQTKKLEFLGEEDNSCSFRIQLKYWPTFFKHLYSDEYAKIRVVTVFECRQWLTFDWLLGCFIEAYVDFHPQSLIDKLAVTLSKIEATWNLTRKKSTLTVLLPSAKSHITSCELKIQLDENRIFLRQYREQKEYSDLVMNSDHFAESDKNRGLSFTGVEDNSCSVQIHLDRLVSPDFVFNKTWTIIQRHTFGYSHGTAEFQKVYKFFMVPKSSWIDYGYSFMVFNTTTNSSMVPTLL